MLFHAQRVWFVGVLAIAGCAVSDDVSSAELALASEGGEELVAAVDPCPEASKIDQLIAQLGDPRYAIREAAKTELATMCGRYQCQERVMAKLAAALTNPDAEISARARQIRFECAGGCTDSQPPTLAKVNCAYSAQASGFTTLGVKCYFADGVCFGKLTIKQTCGEASLHTAPYPGMDDDLAAKITCPDGVMRPLITNLNAGTVLDPSDVEEQLCSTEPRPEHAASIAAQLVATTTFQGDLDEGMCALGDAPNGCGNSAIAQQELEAQLQAKVNAGQQLCRATSAQVSGYVCAGGDTLARSCPALPPGGGGGGAPGGGGGPGGGSGSGSGL